MYASVVVTLCVLTLSPARATDSTRNLGNAEDWGSTTIAAFGDWPYSQELLDGSTKLVNSVNSDPAVKLVVHVGDLHSGSMPCTGAGMNRNVTIVSSSAFPLPTTLPVVNPLWNINVFNAFNKFFDPVLYTPGDNEWCDCHKSKQLSSGAPLAELAGVRSLFFSKPGELLGLTRKVVTSQANAFSNSTDAQFVENVRFIDNDILFATFNIPGGSNDDDVFSPSSSWTGIFTNTTAQNKERQERSAANLRWLDAAFDLATLRQAKIVVIMIQADMWDTEKGFAGQPGLSNYSPFVAKLAARTLSFGKFVLLINGDSHVFKVDTPLFSNNATGPVTALCDKSTNPAVLCDLSKIHGTPQVPNFMRIVVKGSGEAPPFYWLKLKITPRAKTIQTAFTYENVCYDQC